MDLEPPPEARVIVNGEPVEGVDPLFVGTFEEAREFMLSLPPEQQSEVSLFTPDRIYAAADL
ncbi:hypothetical protein [Sphingomonas nostoxanthinifaciens]|uniref:hypothetical protein n=1 Tax=Sphingomonas nostoxanthinifaciens TaxID=2872652 RepID=UPI001CC20103|nr:hypothetical protein [Sphingomonas nostoxanthinifaciens]UAK24598.1 hypothetical protein K8P63_20245 [Sphingomonas nostoxanthinifaciens]